jgi:hypothetical protein
MDLAGCLQEHGSGRNNGESISLPGGIRKGMIADPEVTNSPMFLRPIYLSSCPLFCGFSIVNERTLSHIKATERERWSSPAETSTEGQSLTAEDKLFIQLWGVDQAFVLDLGTLWCPPVSRHGRSTRSAIFER